ncbi:BTB/POZ and MATH domain-containing protein 2-like [Lolium rigidum]|uniref:BTB/POZ and MATH domain-containing protein 2-like n=1 Tax=Lolium rigidum TaxID=89674 RepID=UPI001F5CDACB|nr:BTB/POZ and MATH domain-containing protein 2-like [Lolium rigidum]
MSSFAGVSVVTEGKLCTTSAVDAGADSGYHLLVVKGYSYRTREVSKGQVISSEPFMVGGHQWVIRYYPNGHDPSCADFISLYLRLDAVENHVAAKVQLEFSFVDDVEKQKRIRATETCGFSVQHPSWGYPKFMRRDVLERSAHLKGDCFTIRCDIMVCNTKEDADGTLPGIHEHFDYLLQNKVGADVTFEVSGETFVAHRCVLAARSKVFMAQLFGPMMEATTSTAIQIKDMKPKVFAALLSFIYTDSFPKMDKDIMWLQDLLVAADRYDLQRLKFLCEKQLSEDIDVGSVASTLALADRHHCHGLKEVCFKFIQAQSPECLDKLMMTDGWQCSVTTCPSVLNELVAKLVSNQKKS